LSSTGRSSLSKRAFYSRDDVARQYDRQRFAGPSGARVNARELALVESLLPAAGRVLDLACGTGRLTRRLVARGHRVVAVDSSIAMLRETRRAGTTADGDRSVVGRPPAVVAADAFRLPFADGAFDAVVALRLLFHYADVDPIVREMARVCRTGGVVVFDSASWSPRSRLALAAGRWGGKVFIHPPTALAARLADLGLRVTERRAAFLISPYLYRLLPLPVERALEWLERGLPPSWRSRMVWQVTVGPAGKEATARVQVPEISG
jgi:ubiquinone/menaquinone biosynthesis C-methylase UbiE